MSRPRKTSLWESVGLIALGFITAICISPLLVREYGSPHYRWSFYAILTACCMYPTCILAYTRKNIAQRNGDWHIVLFVLLANYVLFWLATSHR